MIPLRGGIGTYKPAVSDQWPVVSLATSSIPDLGFPPEIVRFPKRNFSFLRDNLSMQILKMPGIRSYRDLVAWQKAMVLVTDIYRHTRTFPREEIYGLTSQLRRAAVLVPSNIAEGQGRASTGEFIHFLGLARGSLFEVETQIQIAHELNFFPPEHCAILLGECAEVGRILNGLMASLPRSGR